MESRNTGVSTSDIQDKLRQADNLKLKGHQDKNFGDAALFGGSVTLLGTAAAWSTCPQVPVAYYIGLTILGASTAVGGFCQSIYGNCEMSQANRIEKDLKTPQLR